MNRAIFAIDSKLSAAHYALTFSDPIVAEVLSYVWLNSKEYREALSYGTVSIDRGLDTLTIAFISSKENASRLARIIERMIKRQISEKEKQVALNNLNAHAKERLEIPEERAISLLYQSAFEGTTYAHYPGSFLVSDVELTKLNEEKDKMKLAAEVLLNNEFSLNLEFADLPKAKYELKPKSVQFSLNKQESVIGYLVQVEGDYYQNILLNTVIGGIPLDSRLENEIRVKRGLAYYAFSRYAAKLRSDHLLILAGCQKGNEEKVKSLIEEQLNKQINEEEIQRAKEYLLNHLIAEYSSISNLIKLTASHMLRGEEIDFHHIAERIRSTQSLGRIHSITNVLIN